MSYYEDDLDYYFDFDPADLEPEPIQIAYKRIVDTTVKGILIESDRGLAWFPRNYVIFYQDNTLVYPANFTPQWDNPAEDFKDL